MTDEEAESYRKQLAGIENREAGLAATNGSASDRAINMCQWAAATLESALLGARKGDIEWALMKTLTAAKTLKRAKNLKAKTPNAAMSDCAGGKLK